MSRKTDEVELKKQKTRNSKKNIKQNKFLSYLDFLRKLRVTLDNLKNTIFKF